ncbi:MAG TPA: hypothetical protein VEL11_18350, partial [Candidatus Bathyarchaeia archaeon]|nr:hypothetical protein [Candidatus Bathyarchaeia archaeon]
NLMAFRQFYVDKISDTYPYEQLLNIPILLLLHLPSSFILCREVRRILIHARLTSSLPSLSLLRSCYHS